MIRCIRLALFAFAFVAIIVSLPVSASEVNFDAVMTDLDKKPIIVDDKPMTLGRAGALALAAQYRDENPKEEEKIRVGLLAQRIYDGGTQNLKAEDIALIKKYLAKMFSPLLLVRALEYLDPASIKSAADK